MIVVCKSRARGGRETLHCLLGPFWPCMFCVTTPMVVGIMYWANTIILPGKHWLAWLIFNLCGSGTLLSLWATSFSDPGILERQRVNRSGARMRWNNNASSFVPSHAMYDSDCGVVIEVSRSCLPLSSLVPLPLPPSSLVSTMKKAFFAVLLSMYNNI